MTDYFLTLLLNPEKPLVATALRLDSGRSIDVRGVAVESFDPESCVLALPRRPEPHDTVFEVVVKVADSEPPGWIVVFLHHQTCRGRMPSPPLADVDPVWFYHSPARAVGSREAERGALLARSEGPGVPRREVLGPKSDPAPPSLHRRPPSPRAGAVMGPRLPRFAIDSDCSGLGTTTLPQRVDCP